MPRCQKWSQQAQDEFIGYVERHGQSALVQAVLRDAQTCKALREIR